VYDFKRTKKFIEQGMFNQIMKIRNDEVCDVNRSKYLELTAQYNYLEHQRYDYTWKEMLGILCDKSILNVCSY